MKKASLLIRLAALFALPGVGIAAEKVSVDAGAGSVQGGSADNQAELAAVTAQLNRHLKAIHKRDLKTYSRTISKTRPVIIVFRNGNVMKGYDDAVQLHRNWFGMKWSIETAVEEIEVYGTMARAQVNIKLAFPQGDGSVFTEDNLVTFLLEKQNGEWLVVFDQGTPIVK